MNIFYLDVKTGPNGADVEEYEISNPMYAFVTLFKIHVAICGLLNTHS